MRGKYPIALVSSFGLHTLFLLALIYTWHTKPIPEELDTIPVKIIADFEGDPLPNTNNDAANQSTASESAQQSAPSEATQQITENESVSSEPHLRSEPSPITKLIEKLEAPTKPQPAPSTKPLPQQQVQKQPQVQKRTANTPNKPVAKPNTPAASKPAVQSASKSNGSLSSQFDLSAAMKSASGVDANGRKAPNLGTSASGLSSGGGELSNDLRLKIMSQMKQCWAEPQGGAASVTVVISVKFKQNGAVISTKLISPSTVGASAAQKIAIDNALKAIRDCSPFDLPANRYAEWGEIKQMRFSTKQLK